jgi:hypothetical protein
MRESSTPKAQPAKMNATRRSQRLCIALQHTRRATMP